MLGQDFLETIHRLQLLYAMPSMINSAVRSADSNIPGASPGCSATPLAASQTPSFRCNVPSTRTGLDAAMESTAFKPEISCSSSLHPEFIFGSLGPFAGFCFVYVVVGSSGYVSPRNLLSVDAQFGGSADRILLPCTGQLATVIVGGFDDKDDTS